MCDGNDKHDNECIVLDGGKATGREEVKVTTTTQQRILDKLGGGGERWGWVEVARELTLVWPVDPRKPGNQPGPGGPPWPRAFHGFPH